MKTPSQLDHVVDRPALRRKLDAVVDHSIALIVAPAGAGKSVLLGQWAGAHPELESAGTGTDSTEQLAKLADLKNQGVITEAEFEAQKAKILA
jgi:ATP/maltotriose-dependent transcriptional regulator MalT